MESCLYEGWVRHRRYGPPHAFRYPLFLAYLDLAELDEVFKGRWLWSTSRPALARFHRADHLGSPAEALDVSVRDLVARRTGARPEGPIRLLTHLRYFGYVFNPVSVYYCFDSTGRHIEAVVADVSNTPWGERHQYVLASSGKEATVRFHHAKTFHVSPFLPMDTDYDWRFTTPGERLAVHMVNREGGRATFDATLSVRRRPITSRSLAAVLVRHPLMTVRVITRIYREAFRLWRKRAIFHPHPRHRQSEGVTR